MHVVDAFGATATAEVFLNGRSVLLPGPARTLGSTGLHLCWGLRVKADLSGTPGMMLLGQPARWGLRESICVGVCGRVKADLSGTPRLVLPGMKSPGGLKRALGLICDIVRPHLT